MSRRSTTFVRLGALLLVSAVLLPVPAAGSTASTSSTASTAALSAGSGIVTITTLSQRADLVAGGDVLVQIDLPAGATTQGLVVDVGGRDITRQFAVRRNGKLLGLLTGLALGKNIVTAELPDGRGARLTVTNHPIGGPVFSGPQVQPWTCHEGALDAQCNKPPAYTYFYKPTSGGGLTEYSPDSPPSDVATTTTDTGETVPFVVRQETGVMARDEYRIAALWDPSNPTSTPFAPPKGYNSKLVLTHGASCGITFSQGEAPDVLNETALGKGFAVASHALDNAGHNCNIATQAESLVMTKERVAELYGPIRYTIGSGCSGGALTQQQVANAYPGVYQGITPACSFTDSWSSGMQKEDYKLLRSFFETPTRWGVGVVWSPLQQASVNGHPNLANPIAFTTAIPNNNDPSRTCPGLAADKTYDAKANPTGVRCTLADYMVNVFGRRPDGKAGKPFDNTGIQYGLAGFQAGLLTAAHFVDINVKIGSRDIDDEPQAVRTAADPLALERVFRSGAANIGTHLDKVAIIDLRGPDPGAFHDVYRTYAMRERLLREHGTADNQVLWRGQVPLFGDPSYANQAILAMDSWLKVVEADTRDVPLPRKILDARTKSGVTERCTNGSGVALPAAVCDGTVESYGTPRFEAGMPLTDDTITCQLKPMAKSDYPASLTDAQFAALREVFPSGVCDYAKPSVAKQPTVAWQTYARVAGGEPLGAAPVSVPFGPVAPARPAAAPPTSTLPTTGAPVAVALLGLLLTGAAILARRRTAPTS